MDFESRIKPMMSEKRYIHSLGVRDEAVKLAKVYGADEKKAYLAGLLHDVVKEFSPEQMRELAKKYGVKLSEVVLHEPKLVHGILGAYYVKYEFGIDDDEIFDAIYYHTTSKANMPLLTKIIYIADSIEPNRDFDGVCELRAATYENLDKAILMSLRKTIDKLLKNGRLIHVETVNAMNYLLMKGCGI